LGRAIYSRKVLIMQRVANLMAQRKRRRHGVSQRVYVKK
jgi:hypothetical protein